MAALNSLVLFKKYTTNQNQKGKVCGFKDFVLDCIQKMTEPEGREDKKVSADDESLALMSAVQTPLLRKRRPVKGPPTICRVDSKFIKWLMFHQAKKRGAASRRHRVCSACNQRKETSFMCSTCVVVLCKTPCFGKYHMKKSY